MLQQQCCYYCGIIARNAVVAARVVVVIVVTTMALRWYGAATCDVVVLWHYDVTALQLATL